MDVWVVSKVEHTRWDDVCDVESTILGVYAIREDAKAAVVAEYERDLQERIEHISRYDYTLGESRDDYKRRLDYLKTQEWTDGADCSVLKGGLDYWFTDPWCINRVTVGERAAVNPEREPAVA